LEIEDVEDHSFRVDVAASVPVLVDNSIGCRMVDVPTVKTDDTIEPRTKAVAVGAAVVDAPIADAAVVDVVFVDSVVVNSVVANSVVVETDAEKLVVRAAFNVLDVDPTDCSVVALGMVDIDELDADELKLFAPSQ
jgi:hypothetical protein